MKKIYLGVFSAFLDGQKRHSAVLSINKDELDYRADVFGYIAKAYPNAQQITEVVTDEVPVEYLITMLEKLGYDVRIKSSEGAVIERLTR